MALTFDALTDEQRQKIQEDRLNAVHLRHSKLGYDDLPELTGFEDEYTKRLILAKHYLRKAKVSTLRPMLPLLLQLKGKPYKLEKYFPFEPFFRTRMSAITLLKTGRQVSKCMDEDEPVLLANGQRVAAKEVRVGDIVLSFARTVGKFVPHKVTNVWETGYKAVKLLVTRSGFKVRVTPEHRLLVQSQTGNFRAFTAAQYIYAGDRLAVQGKTGELEWEQVVSVSDDGFANTRDIEVEEEHNFILGRCVSHNSTSLAAQGVVFSNSIEYFSTLYVTPLFEMIRRFSHNYVRQFLETSPARRLFTGTKQMNSVLQRNFKNGSAMYFSYAFLDAERTRGIPADKNVIDEVQDMNYDFLQIIHETLSGSKWGVKQYAGTPKSLDNTMERLWQDSSQAEWMIRCRTAGCRHWNVPAVTHDLYDMIGEWHSEISSECPGVVCAKCRKPLAPHTGMWVHAFPERHWQFSGYHVPQIIMPIHYESEEKWGVLVGKMKGRGNTTPTTFLNEVCGESCDSGSKLVTVTDLKMAAILPWPRKPATHAIKQISRYVRRILAIDWGGGGGRLSNTAKKTGEQQRLRTSYTTYSVLGELPDGRIDCIWGHRSVRTHDFEYEAQLALEAVVKFKCQHIAHDFSNAGEGRLVLIYQSGFPLLNIFNVRYHGVGHAYMHQYEPTDDCPHIITSLDKSRSLVTTCGAIKHGLLRFFQYDHINNDDAGLLHDFLALIEEKIDSRIGTDIYTIVRNPNASDDFAHSTNIGANCLWFMRGKFPDIAEAAKMKIPPHLLKHVHPKTKVQWDDI